MLRRLVPLVLLAAAAAGLPGSALGERAVIVLRHAEKISESDQRLTEAGRARAQRLAAMLKAAGVTSIYATDTERAIGTVQPLADALKLKVEIYDPKNAEGKLESGPLVARIRKRGDDGVALVVGHSNTVPDLLKALGCPGEVTLAPDEYDNLFIVVPGDEGAATLMRVRY